MRSKHIFKKMGYSAFILSGAFLIASLVMSFFPANQAFAADSIIVCHWNASGKYNSISVDVSSVDNFLTGHGSHPNDIWAAFITGDGVSVPAQGDQSILNNGCVVPAVPTDTFTPTFTDTPTNTPTGTSTGTSTNTPTGTSTVTTTNTPTSTLNPQAPTSTLIPPILTFTPTLTLRPQDPTYTPITPTPTYTPVTLTPTFTPIPSTPTLILVTVTPPALGGSNVIFPVTGMDLGAFSRGLPRAFAYTSLGFIGLGLVLIGIDRRFTE